MLGCVVSVIGALLEYGMVLFIKFRHDNNIKIERTNKIEDRKKARGIKEEGNTKQCSKSHITTTAVETFSETRPAFVRQEDENGGLDDTNIESTNLRSLDFISLIVFPTAFFIFIMVYGLYFYIIF